MSQPEKRTFSEAQMASAKKRAKFAWSQIYRLHGQNAVMARMLANFFPRENGALQRPAEFPAHITEQLWDMANRLNETYTCPVCLDLTTKDTFHLTVCGHILCKDCRLGLRYPECPLCRTKLAPVAAGALSSSPPANE